ncbi:hypothetical protein [Micromonospora radicis]|uniref:Uncharacterized protein n=1 Tax=Micromonospora radicis TaxID=1894971 RepID=A0A418MVI4_9ACTN|nr:hypothetical protein [Micromonospora radicis]RIV38425.1 hypothetical protein D2L64_12855 [Micromonospora radicis]
MPEPEPRNNYGVYVHGNQTGAAAVNGDAIVYQQVPNNDPAELARILDQLRTIRSLIEANRSALPEADLAIRDVDRIADLLQAEQLDRTSIKAGMDRLLHRMGAAGSLAGGMIALHQLVTGFLG